MNEAILKLEAHVKLVAASFIFRDGNTLREVDFQHFERIRENAVEFISVDVHLYGMYPGGGQFNTNLKAFKAEAFPNELLEECGFVVQDSCVLYNTRFSTGCRYWFQLVKSN